MHDQLPGSEGRILIVGLGNELLRDDGVGVHAARALHGALPPGVLAVEVGAAVLDALHLFEVAARVLAIDAMQAGGAPGTLYLCRIREIAEADHQASLHELGLLAALRFLPRSAQPEVTVLGVEPESITYSLELSPPVAAALPRVLTTTRQIVAGWRGGGVTQTGPLLL